MREGDVILTPVPQADGALKNRPAIVLREMPPYRDLLVCGVSTQLQREVKGFDETISRADDDFTTGDARQLAHASTSTSSSVIGGGTGSPCASRLSR